MTGVLVAGTSSDSGKSLVVAALCRALSDRGIDVAPYKAQNMSNNSMVCSDGSEIGRAQYLQALAARVTPSSAMNPVLLKPGTDRRAFVVLRGQPGGTLEAGEYATERTVLRETAWAAYEELAAEHELVVCEGAGSPAEINLRHGDYTNMGLARRFRLPTVLVGDIDRGGVLAAIFGTWGIVEPEDRALFAAYLINKFRGDASILEPGLVELTRRTGLPSLGVLPWLPDVWIDGEDVQALARWHREEDVSRHLRVAVVGLPRISNATDVDPLADEPGVDVMVTADPDLVRRADVVVIPGSRSTVADLTWLRDRGLDEAMADRPVLGICGGYQMLARTISDPVESGSSTPVRGLGRVPADVVFHPEKVLGTPHGVWRGHQVSGYTIHHGRVTVEGDVEPFLDGCHVGRTWGTMWHGALESDGFRRAWLAEVAAEAGVDWQPRTAGSGFASRREAMLQRLGAAVEQHVDVDAVLAMARASR